MSCTQRVTCPSRLMIWNKCPFTLTSPNSRRGYPSLKLPQKDNKLCTVGFWFGNYQLSCGYFTLQSITHCILHTARLGPMGFYKVTFWMLSHNRVYHQGCLCNYCTCYQNFRLYELPGKDASAKDWDLLGKTHQPLRAIISKMAYCAAKRVFHIHVSGMC